MLQPPAVDVDIILDQYLGSIFPASLLPTAVYLVALAVLGWVLSRAVWALLKPAERSKAHID